MIAMQHLSRTPLAQRYLEHVIADGAPLATSVRLDTHGEIRLGSHWCPFDAEQRIHQGGEFVWAATVRLFGLLPIRGADQLLAGEGSMSWKLFGLIPVIKASGPDVTRSARGRLDGELVHWLPSSLLSDNVRFEESGSVLRIARGASPTIVEIDLDAQGCPRLARFNRWGNPDGKRYRQETFVVHIEEERSFGGFTVPSRIRAGWTGQEFFRAVIDQAEFR